MNEYKKLIKSPATRKRMLDMLSFVPDKSMLKLQYRIKLGRTLDIDNPQRFTEKLQWYKINYRNPILHQCVDKYQVRKYVSSKHLDEILVPCYGVYDSLDEVQWDTLPKSFILKTTTGGGGLNVLICKNKTKQSPENIKKKFEGTDAVFKKNSGGREWAYYGLKRRYIFERLMINKENPKAGINDYKIFCYDGKPQYIIVDVDRYIGHKRNFYDINWNNLNVTSDCPAADREIERPTELDKMLQIATKLSEGFPFVRVDLYNVDGHIYFGELTFYPWSGYVQFMPDEFDYELGSKFRLPLIGGGYN